MVERGADHLGALCVVAARLAERAWTVMNRRMPYVICDTDGTPVTPDAGQEIIAEHWTVPARSAAGDAAREGKAPQQVLTDMTGQTREAAQRGDLPRPIVRDHHTDQSSHQPLDNQSPIGNQRRPRVGTPPTSCARGNGTGSGSARVSDSSTSGVGRVTPPSRLSDDLGPTGEVVGIDATAAMLAVTGERAVGRPCPIRFTVGDATALDQPNASFDAVRSERTLQWLADPAAAADEMARVLRPGGRLALIDTDWSTFDLDVGDEVAAVVREAVRFERNRPSHVGRRLGELVQAAGFDDVVEAPPRRSGRNGIRTPRRPRTGASRWGAWPTTSSRWANSTGRRRPVRRHDPRRRSTRPLLHGAHDVRRRRLLPDAGSHLSLTRAGRRTH